MATVLPLLLSLLSSVVQPAPCHLVREDLFTLSRGRYGAAAVADDHAVYVIGGQALDGLVGSVERFQPRTSRWEQLAGNLVPRRYVTAALVGEWLYVLGGYDGKGPTAAVERVRLTDGRRELRRPLPTPRYFASAAVLDGKIFLAGGRDARGRTAAVDIYDPQADSWTSGPALLQARDTRLVVVAGQLYALPGYGGETQDATDSVEVLAPDRSAWLLHGRAPFPTSAFASAVLGDDVFLLGDYRALGQVQRYRPEDGTFQALRAAYSPRRHAAAAAVGERIVVVGGNVASSGSHLGTVEVFAWRCGPERAPVDCTAARQDVEGAPVEEVVARAAAAQEACGVGLGLRVAAARVLLRGQRTAEAVDLLLDEVNRPGVDPQAHRLLHSLGQGLPAPARERARGMGQDEDQPVYVAAVPEEYAWVKDLACPTGTGKVRQQALLANGRRRDRVRVGCPDGTTRTLYFDFVSAAAR